MTEFKKRRGVFPGVVLALIVCLMMGVLAGCSSFENEAQSELESVQGEALPYEGKALAVYCGAGMTDPFQKIADAFNVETGCKVEVTFANAAQIQTQIETTKSGDFFIAGSAEELQRVDEFVTGSVDLVKHIPVLAVPANNPKDIHSLADLENADLLLIGDPESTPIGKIAKKALTNAGLWEDLAARDAISTTTTAPQIATALAKGEGDAGIVWKENVKADGAVIVDTHDLDTMIKTIPAAQLSFASDTELVDAFNTFMLSDTAMDIWKSYGYEPAN